MATKAAKSQHKRDPSQAKPGNSDKSTMRFAPANVDALFEVLDAIAWVGSATLQQISQFAGIDPRTAGKLLRNADLLGLVESVDGKDFSLILPYPYKGSIEQKRAVVREAMVRMPLLENVRQFLSLGETLQNALRKGATIVGVENFEPSALSPLVKWAQQLRALEPRLSVEALAESATVAKADRHRAQAEKKVVFLSHSSKDKPIIRKLAADLTAEGIGVWLDEQRIRVGESIAGRIAQGLAESDYFLVALSQHSVASEWVTRELNTALMNEIAKRQVSILPIKLESCDIPELIKDKKYADFSVSYGTGMRELLSAIKGDVEA